MDTLNKFGVGMSGYGQIVIMKFGAVMSRDDALVLAAWLVALADMRGEFDKLLEEVKST